MSAAAAQPSQPLDSGVIKFRAPGDLKPYPKNARTHSEAQIEQIMNSIKEFGFTAPILTHKSIGIVAGHGRLEASLRLGLQTVPTVALDHLTKKQARAYVIADNQLALKAGWDFDTLKLELGELEEMNFDLSLTGFDDADLGQVFADTDIDFDALWAGMPEYVSDDQLAFRKLIVNFTCQADVDKFAALIGQTLTDKTRFVWFPPVEQDAVQSREYVGEAQDAA